jgi:hypothetical protein
MTRTARNPKRFVSPSVEFFERHAEDLEQLEFATDLRSPEDYAAAHEWARAQGYRFDLDPFEDRYGDTIWSIGIIDPPTTRFPEGRRSDDMKFTRKPDKSTRRLVEAMLAQRAREYSGRARNPRESADQLINPHRYPNAQRNGAGLGAFLGSIVGSVPGVAVGSGALTYIGWVAGGAIGGHMGAPRDRKKRGAIGGAVGSAIFGPLGAALGGYLGGRKPDKRRNPKENLTPEGHTKMANQVAREIERETDAVVDHVESGNMPAAVGGILRVAKLYGEFKVHAVWAAESPTEAQRQVEQSINNIDQILGNLPGKFKTVRFPAYTMAANPHAASDALQLAEIDGRRALSASERAITRANAGEYDKAIADLGAAAYYVGACEAHFMYDDHDHSGVWIDYVKPVAENAIQAMGIMKNAATMMLAQGAV